eukprot:111035-Rhodomonas_salina.1
MNTESVFCSCNPAYARVLGGVRRPPGEIEALVCIDSQPFCFASQVDLRRLAFVQLQQPELAARDSRHDSHPTCEDLGPDLVGLVEAREHERVAIQTNLLLLTPEPSAQVATFIPRSFDADDTTAPNSHSRLYLCERRYRVSIKEMPSVPGCRVISWVEGSRKGQDLLRVVALTRYSTPYEFNDSKRKPRQSSETKK